ncbi:MAG: hypothetical protein WBP12_04730 [Candidatus Saccharimonas sp.]
MNTHTKKGGIVARSRQARAKAKKSTRRAAKPDNMGANPARMRGTVARAGGNAAGAHQKGIRGQRDRAGAKRHAIAESVGE